MSGSTRRDVLRSGAGAAGVAASACTAGCAGATRTRPAAPPSDTSPSAHPSRTRDDARHAPVPRRLPGLPAQVVRGPHDRAAVALTFHGQGDPSLADAVLSEAERAGARLTVLAVGSWLVRYPRMARRVLDGGHELGNHTMRHRAVCALPADEALAEITECADRLRRLTGGIGSWFRPSQARTATDQVVRLARRAGYPHVLSYDVDSHDFEDPGAAAVRDNVLDRVRAGSVVSLHLGHDGTRAALPAILHGLHERGLSAITTTELMA